MHPNKFDHGLVICQTPAPGFQHHCDTVQDLVRLTAGEGARMLLKCIINGEFVSPQHRVVLGKDDGAETPLHRAPKITPEDRHIDWDAWTADDIIRKHRIFGPLWNLCTASIHGRSMNKRIIWSSGFREVKSIYAPVVSPGKPFIMGLLGLEPYVYLKTCDNRILLVAELTVEGQQRSDPIQSARKAGLFSGDHLQYMPVLENSLLANRLLHGKLV